MICDALQEDEIFEACLLHASLHGFSTDEAELRDRISKYLNNQPDTVIDDAILAFAEDRIIAPPDVVLAHWGKSRIYQLLETPNGQWRHRVSDPWFENGCQFFNDPERDPELAHFWTSCDVDVRGRQHLTTINLGTRLKFRLREQDVIVSHRHAGDLGKLPSNLAAEMNLRDRLGIRYLPLVDAIDQQGVRITLKLLVTIAGPTVSIQDMVLHARRAFEAARNRC